MPVLIGRVDPLDINCLIWVGSVSKPDALGFPGRIDAARPEFGCRWISYFHSMTDLSELEPKCLFELRERLRPIVLKLGAKCEFRMMLVSQSRYNDPLLAVWENLTGADPQYRSTPVVVHDISSAADGLGLSADDAELIQLWIDSRLAEFASGSS